MRPGKARVKRVEITRRNDNDTARVEITMAKRERRAGIGQVLDHVEHHNDVHHPELGEVAFIGNSGRYVQSALAAGAARSALPTAAPNAADCRKPRRVRFEG